MVKGQTYFILAIIFIIIISIFSVANVNPVEVDYIFWQGATPLIFIILFSVLFGSLITILIGSVKYFKLQKENKHLKEQTKQRKTRSTKSSDPVTPTTKK